MKNTLMIWNFVLSLVALVIALIFNLDILLGWSIGAITILSVIGLEKATSQ